MSQFKINYVGLTMYRGLECETETIDNIFSATKPRKESLKYNYDRTSQLIALTGDER